jgi:hypothetical protein
MKIGFLGLFLVASLSSAVSGASDFAATHPDLLGYGDFVAPVVKDDTVLPKQTGSIFFNAAAGQFQGFGLSGNTIAFAGVGTERIFSAAFGGATELNDCNSSPCTIYRQHDTEGNTDTVASVTRSGAGLYTINITSGRCSAAPVCTGSSIANIRFFIEYSVPTSTSYAFTSINPSSVTTDGGFNVNCSCPK